MKNFTVLVAMLLMASASMYGMQEKKSLAEWWAVVEAAQGKKSIPAFSAQPNKALYSVESPLHWAAACGDTELVTALITVVKIPVDIRNSNNATALHKAARSLNVATVRALIKAHADVNAVDDNGSTPMHLLLKRTDEKVIEVVKILLDEGSAHVNAQDALGWTPLHCAVQKMNKDIIRLLIEHDADLKIMNREKHSPLYTENASLQGEILGIVLEVERRKEARAIQVAKIQKGISEFVKRSQVLAAQTKKTITVAPEEEKHEETRPVVKPVVAPLPIKAIALMGQPKPPVASLPITNVPVTVQPSLLQNLSSFEEAVIGMVNDILKIYEPMGATEETKEEKPKSADAIRQHVRSSLHTLVEAIDAEWLMQLVWNKNLAAVYRYHHDMRDEVKTRVCNLLACYAMLELKHQTSQALPDQTPSTQTTQVPSEHTLSVQTTIDSARGYYNSAPKINESYIPSSQVLAISPRSTSALQEEFVMVTQSV